MSKLPTIGVGDGTDEGHHGGPHLHKTLWEGTKNFWRTRENVDVRIIEHTDANALEIIGFSVDRHEEADRVFLYADKVYKKLDNEELAERISSKREELSRLRKRVPNDEIKSGLLQELSVNYVLARLAPGLTTVPPRQKSSVTATETNTEDDNHSEGATSNEADSHQNEQLDKMDTEAVRTDENNNNNNNNIESMTEGGLTTSEEQMTETSTESTLERKLEKASKKTTAPELCEPRFSIEFVALTGDKKDPKTGFIDVLMTRDPPVDSIEHIVIKRARKKATTKEFNQALRSLRQDSHKLNAAMSDAQRKAGLAVSSVEGFQNFLSRATYDPETMSLARWRWVKSIRRVILQNAVAATTKRLERYSMSDFPSEKEKAEADNLSLGGPARRIKPSASTTKLPLLQQAKVEKEKAKRKSMGSLRRIARGSREPRPINDFSSAFSGGLQTRADSHMNGTVLTSSDIMKKYGMSPEKVGLGSSESTGALPHMKN
jgi:hypothetical protein